MISFLLIAVASAELLRFQGTELGDRANDLVNDQEFIDKLNSENIGWVAGANQKFDGWTLGQAQRLMGVLNSTEPSPIKDFYKPDRYMDLPTNFDWRDQSSTCPSLAEVRDQSNCGSCWAFGSVEAMTDRICIASKGKVKAHLSTQEVTSCDKLSDMGCNGGIPATAYMYYKTVGVVTGGNYGDKTECWSYQLPPCAHHTNSTKYPACDGDTKTPKCKRECENGDKWDNDKHYGNSTYHYQNVNDMMQDIYQNGPITAQFFVYSDFLTYTSGVYAHKIGHGQMLGGHAIKIMGFGVEDNTPYWLIANSWNEDWGDHGFFKILRGKNNCQIENFALNGGPVAGTPSL